MNRFLVGMLSAFVLVTGCSEHAERILAPTSDARTGEVVRDRVQKNDTYREDTIHAADYAGDVQLASAGSIIVAAGSMDYSFTLRYRRFVGAGCTLGGDLFTTVFGVSDFGFAIDFPSRLSVELEAPASANDGTPFHRWQGPSGFLSASRTICVDEPAGIDTYAAFFEVAAGNTAPVLSAIGAQTINELETLAFMATASDPETPAQTLSFRLQNGASGMVPEGASIDAAGSFSWTPTEAQGPASFTFDVCVSDDAVPPLEDCETVTVHVLEVNLAPSVEAIAPMSANEGETVSFVAVATDADVPLNPLTFSLSGAPAGATIDPHSGAFSWTVPDDAGSPFAFVVAVMDESGASAQTSVSIAVANVAPTISSLSGSPIAPVSVGLVGITGSFADPALADIHAIDVQCNAEGPALPGNGAIVQESLDWSATCHYAEPGIYRVRVTITDDEGGAGAVVTDPIVAYDPDAGFVTGGGWFDSPPGAYPADPALAGRAHFAFVSRYKKGAPAPGGNTEFSLKSAGSRFRSTSYDWLVVSGNHAVFRGAGVLDDQPGYRFEIQVTDGATRNDADRIQVRVWNAESGAIVYDNGMGAGNTPAASAAVVEGSIVIHDGKTTVQSQKSKR